MTLGPDDTADYVGWLPVDGDRVRCHLCGRWYLSVASHLFSHGWTKAQYVAEFGLELSNPLCGPATRRRRSDALRQRSAVEPVIRTAQEAARARAQDGSLSRAAAEAARGRPHPPERRAKTLAGLAAVSAESRTAGSRRRATVDIEHKGAQIACRLGFADFAAYAENRADAGWSMAAISREAGQHKDWLARHVGHLAPTLAKEADDVRRRRLDRQWLPVVAGLGFTDVAAYLSHRHLDERRTVRAIANEIGMSRPAVSGALRRHDIPYQPHATSRHDAERGSERQARRLGFADISDYICVRRSAGTTWAAMASETGQSASWLRRRLR